MALHDAVKSLDIETVKTLIASGNDVNEKDKLNRTPLHLAAWKGNSEIIQLLLRSKACVTDKAMDGFTPLHFAVQSGDLLSCELLLKKNKALLSARTTKANKTVLHVAAHKNDLPMVQLLLSVGADVSALTNKRQTAFDMATSEEIRTALSDALNVVIEEQEKSKFSKAQSLNEPKDSLDNNITVESTPHSSSVNVAEKPSKHSRNEPLDGEVTAAEAAVPKKKIKSVIPIMSHLLEDGDL